MEQASVTSAYMWAFVIMIVFFLIAVVIANMIVFKPKDPGTTARRIWFWILCVATAVVAFVVNYFIAKGISVPSLQSDYMMHSAIAAAAAAVFYILFGYGVSKVFSSSKVGTWF